MGLGTSLFLIAVGAILAFAVNVEADGFDINTIGVILMIVGIVGLLLSFFYLSTRDRRGAVVERERVREDPRL